MVPRTSISVQGVDKTPWTLIAASLRTKLVAGTQHGTSDPSLGGPLEIARRSREGLPDWDLSALRGPARLC